MKFLSKYRTVAVAAIASLLTALAVAQAQVPGVNSTLATVFTMAYDNSTMMPTYSATSVFNPASANPTDVCSLSGSATKVVKVRRIMFGMVATTAVTDPIAIIKRSTANTGAGTAMTKASYDSANASNTVAVAEVWTALPVLGVTQALLAEVLYSVGNLTTGGAQSFPSQLVYGNLGSPIVLRGVAQSVAINFFGGTYPSAVGTCTFEWTEQ